MPKRAVGVLRNLQGHAIHNTRKTALQKMWRRQSIAIPIPQGRRTWTKHWYEFSIFFYLLMVSPKISILRKGTHEQGPSKGWLVFWRNKDTQMWLDFPHSARILNVHLMLINVAAVGCSTTHQQNRKVPTLIGRQYIVLQIWGSMAELGKAEKNFWASLYLWSIW